MQITWKAPWTGFAQATQLGDQHLAVVFRKL